MSAGKSICKMKAFSHIIWKNKDSLITGFMESIKTYVNQEQIIIEKGTHCPNQNCLILLKAKPARIIFVKILLSPWDLFFPPCLHLLASLLHFFSLLHSFLQTFFANSTQYQQRIPETWTVKSYTLPCAKLCDPSSGWLFVGGLGDSVYLAHVKMTTTVLNQFDVLGAIRVTKQMQK